MFGEKILFSFYQIDGTKVVSILKQLRMCRGMHS